MKIRRIHIFENRLSLLNEDVYTKNLDDRNKKANITYKKGVDSQRMAKNGIVPGESLKTDKMDAQNSETYIVPLKNGINSYNITNIEGKEIMHYFKNHFSKEATTFDVKLNGKKEKYELEMENSEIRQFLKQFVEKINFVLYDYVSKHKELTDKENYTFSKICIYPVKSSSNFNDKVVDLLLRSNMQIFGMPIMKLNENLLSKDISNIQKDEDFITKNSEYYNSLRGNFNPQKGKSFKPGVPSQTHMNGLNTDLKMFQARNRLNKEIEELNVKTDLLRNAANTYNYKINHGDTRGAETVAKRIASIFPEYCKRSQNSAIMKFAEYEDDFGNKISKKNVDTHASKAKKEAGKNFLYYRLKKSAKGPAERDVTPLIIDLTRKYNPNGFKTLSKKELENVRVIKLEPVDFQIKKIFNDSRMGLKNLFSFNQKELEKVRKEIEGNILVIFDDNVSGGATLSDICAQFLNVGVKHIIPITFGKMFQQWGGNYDVGWAKIAEPKDGFVFGDGKTFVYKGYTFKTDEITNPMDAANLYQEKFGNYDKQGVMGLINVCQKVKNGDTSYSIPIGDTSEPFRMAAEKVPNRSPRPADRKGTVRPKQPFKINKIDGKNGVVSYTSPKPLTSEEYASLLKQIAKQLNKNLIKVDGMLHDYQWTPSKVARRFKIINK